MLVGGQVTSKPAATHCACAASTSSIQTDIHEPLSPCWSPACWKVVRLSPRPRPPCPSRHRNIRLLPEPTAPNVGGVPQSHSFFHPHFLNHAKLAGKSETFSIGVRPSTFIARKDNTPRLRAGHRSRNTLSTRCRGNGQPLTQRRWLAIRVGRSRTHGRIRVVCP